MWTFKNVVHLWQYNIVTKSYIIEKQKSEKSDLSNHMNFEVNFCSYLEPDIILH